MRRFVSAALVMLLSMAMVFASGTGETQAAAEGPVDIVWAGWSGEEEATRDIFQRMREGYEAQSGNSVTWVGWTWADTAQQLLIRMQGSEPLDIAQADIAIFNTIAQTGALADLSELIDPAVLEDISPAALSVGNIGGKQVGLPWSMAAITMVYNPEILKEAGWNEPPKTMEEFEACLADVKALGGDIVPYGVSTKDATCAGDFMPWLWTFGGTIYNEDGSVNLGETAVECVKWYQDMLAKGYIAMDIGRGDARQLFAQGKMAFYDDAVLAKGQAVANGVAPEDVVNVCSAMPRPVFNEGDEPQSTMWGHLLMIFEKSEHKEEAADFAEYLLSNDVAMEYFEQNGMPPVTGSASSLDEVKNDAYLQGFLAATETAKLEETAMMTDANEIKSIITEELQAALLGSKSAEDAVADMTTRLESL